VGHQLIIFFIKSDVVARCLPSVRRVSPHCSFATLIPLKLTLVFLFVGHLHNESAMPICGQYDLPPTLGFEVTQSVTGGLAQLITDTQLKK
jgi:hypothetical protein